MIARKKITLLTNFRKAKHNFRKLGTDSTRENEIPLSNLVKHIPGFTRNNLSSRLSYHACPLRVMPHIENSIQFLNLHSTRGGETVGVRGKATTVVRADVLWMEHMSFEQCLKKLGLFSQLRKTPLDNVIPACKYLEGG